MLEKALQIAGKNRHELEKVLAHYKNDSLKYLSACYLIENMHDKVHYRNAVIDTLLSQLEHNNGHSLSHDKIWEELRPRIYNNEDKIRAATREKKDLQVISSAELIENIDMAFYVWENIPWSQEYDYSQFLEFILPYKTLNAKPEKWRRKLFEKYKWVLDSLANPNDPLEAAHVLNEYLYNKYGLNQEIAWITGIDVINISDIDLIKQGTCFGSTVYITSILRALGIGSSAIMTKVIDPPTIGVHCENVVATGNDKFTRLSLADTEIELADEAFFGKWYMEQYAPNQDFSKLLKEKEFPPNLKNPYHKDVTQFVTKTRDITFDLQCVKDDQIVFLVVPLRRGDWRAIAFSKIKDSKVLFKNVGVGLTYFPMLYKWGEFKRCGQPIRILKNGQAEFLLTQGNDEKISLTLERKYPLEDEKKEWAASLIGSKIVFYDSSFSKAHAIELSDTIYTPKNIKLSGSKKYRYAKLICKGKNKDYGLAEISFQNSMKKHDAKIILPDHLDLFNEEFSNVIDSNLETYAHIGSDHFRQKDVWLGFDFGEAVTIASVEICPRTDTNFVEPGDVYQLDYLDEQIWKKHEMKMSDSYIISFDNVPKNKIYLLRNLSKGREEYPFTYEEGKQVWLYGE